MLAKKDHAAITGSLLLVVVLWGGNNAGTKWLVGSWPPVWTGCTRFLFAGLILLAVLRWTPWLGRFTAADAPTALGSYGGAAA